MIQTQTFSFDKDTREKLVTLSRAIEQNRDNREVLVRLIAEHDELTKLGKVALYDPHEEAKWL